MCMCLQTLSINGVIINNVCIRKGQLSFYYTFGLFHRTFKEHNYYPFICISLMLELYRLHIIAWTKIYVNFLLKFKQFIHNYEHISLCTLVLYYYLPMARIKKGKCLFFIFLNLSIS